MRFEHLLETSWRFLRRYFRMPRTLRITAAGWKFLGMTLVVGMAAVNTANNLLYLVFGLMLSFIMASSILSELMLRNLSLERAFPRHLFVGQPAPVTVTARNNKRLIASLALVVEDATPGTTSPNTAYVLKVPARGAVSVTYPMTFARRGLHRPGKIRISTGYPFGLFRKAATFAEYDDVLLVFPEITPLSPAAIPQALAHIGAIVAAVKGQGVDLHGIREYVAGDGSGRIHWKSSARLGTLMTKEFHDDQRKRIAVVLDASLPPGQAPTALFQDMERAIALAASYAVLLIGQQFQVQLITTGSRSAFADGQRHLFMLLRTLALFQPEKGRVPQDLSRALRTLERAGTSRIVIGPGRVE